VEVEIIGVPNGPKGLVINGVEEAILATDVGVMIANVSFESPKLDLPSLRKLEWYYINSLPEIAASYDDRGWPVADQALIGTSNDIAPAVSLHSSDYGFHAGVLVFRGHFEAAGATGTLKLKTQGGSAFASSVWLNGTFIGSWIGDPSTSSKQQKYILAGLEKGQQYVLTVLVDNMGYDENWVIGLDTGKAPRGILSCSLSFGFFRTTDITWKITGNLGGEDYADRVRGPLNEGGLYVERQGLHQPRPPILEFNFTNLSSLPGILPDPGVAFFATKLNLSLPAEKWDIPLAFTFGNDTSGAAIRAQLWVNGWNFGRFVSNIGPQTRFPVPEGILDYQGENWIGLAVWTLAVGAKLPDFELSAGQPVLTGREPVKLVDSPTWQARDGAY
jgi:hypothetical protein